MHKIVTIVINQMQNKVFVEMFFDLPAIFVFMNRTILMILRFTINRE